KAHDLWRVRSLHGVELARVSPLCRRLQPCGSRRGWAARGPTASSVLQDESDFQVDAVLGDLSAADRHLLLLHPGAGYVLQRLAGAFYAQLNGVFETPVGRGADFS